MESSIIEYYQKHLYSIRLEATLIVWSYEKMETHLYLCGVSGIMFKRQHIDLLFYEEMSQNEYLPA